MKNSIKITIAALSAILSLASCQKEEAKLFDSSSSARMTEYLANAKSVLTASTYGWVFDYYPEANQSYGGWTYTLDFDDSLNTKVMIEPTMLSDPESYLVAESTYNLIADDGPVLTFDTYNDLMHFFATPDAYNYQGYEGDYEFIILDVESDKITLKGKRTGNSMYLFKLGKEMKEYLADQYEIVQTCEDMVDFGYDIFNATVGDSTYYLTIDPSGRQAEIYTGNGFDEPRAFVFTDKGIRLYQSVDLGDGKEVFDFTLSYTEGSDPEFHCTDEGATDVVFKFQRPENHLDFNSFAGNWFLNFGDGQKVAITLTPNEDGDAFTMTGLSLSESGEDNYTVDVKYSKAKGRIEIRSQIVGEYDGYIESLVGWDGESGYDVNRNSGLAGEWNMDSSNPAIILSDLGTGSTTVTGLALYETYLFWGAFLIDIGPADTSLWPVTGYTSSEIAKCTSLTRN